MEIDDTELLILNLAESLFIRYGYKKTTMEEIAKNLQMSRKTLYKYFSNKAELIEKVISVKFLIIHASIEKIILHPSDTIPKKLENINQFYHSELMSGMDKIITEIKNYQPEMWNRLKQDKTKNDKHLNMLMEEGKKKGYFNKAIDTSLFIEIFKNGHNFLEELDAQRIIPLTHLEMASQFFNIMFHGIFATDKKKTN